MSPRKQQKFIRHFSNAEKSRKKFLIRASEILGERGYKIFPSTRDQIYKDLKRAEDVRTIRTLEEYKLCGAALMAAGARHAREQGTILVRVQDVEAGWSGKLRMGPGNCRPHHCSRLSVLERESAVREMLPEVEIILDES